MQAYPLLSTRGERLVAWLAFNGLELQRRGKDGADFIRVPRRKAGAMKLWLHDNGRTATFVGDRKSHRSTHVERLMREWNFAELALASGTRYLQLADHADHNVQSMVDYHAANPIGLESIGQADDRITWNAKRLRTETTRFILIPDLSALVTSLRCRQAYVDELARRDANFGQMERAS
jgi:hypothetical protein